MRPEMIGERALARALSDIAAAGGDPRCCLVALAVPRTKSDRWILSFFRGLLRLAGRTGTVLAGGDLAHDDKVHCSVMVVGAVEARESSDARRRPARRPPIRLRPSRQTVGSENRPAARPRPEARGQSDGVHRSERRLSRSICTGCARNLGVAAEVDRVPIVRGASLERALHGGEDYELLFTLPPRVKPPAGTTRIGTIVRGTAGTVWFEGKSSRRAATTTSSD